VARDDKNDLIFKSVEGKFQAVMRDIKERHEQGQPVLVGTIAVETSEYLSELLKRQGIPHSVLNAKEHAREAEIIKDAGQRGTVTIATNMAGRGVDIKLGEGVSEVGGLHVIGTERHESRRIDNQLRGRAGRQGDPGSSRFYLSLDDDLMKRFASDRVTGLMERLGLEEDVAIESRLVSKTIESAQSRVEGFNFDIRKRVVEFDDVINRQRETIYAERDKVLRNEDLTETIRVFLDEDLEELAERRVVLDVTPVSNLRTGVVASLEDHPLPELVAAGVPCTVSTDDPEMFDTDLTREYDAALSIGADPKALYEVGVEGALCSDETRARLRRIGEDYDWSAISGAPINPRARQRFSKNTAAQIAFVSSVPRSAA